MKNVAWVLIEHMVLNTIENEIINHGYVPHIPYNRKRGEMKEETANQRRYSYDKNKRWVVERTNS